MSKYRNIRLLNLAKNETCVHCGIQDGSVCMRHSNLLEHGKGRGIKAHDYCIMLLCDEGDAWLNSQPKKEIREWTYIYIVKTLGYLFSSMKIGVL